MCGFGGGDGLVMLVVILVEIVVDVILVVISGDDTSRSCGGCYSSSNLSKGRESN